ncbi:hypothetical protein EDD18DRAFT_1353194 [Armillaria luteobubalina]|uniref:Uncharacterized protein n=1 Tax=Armillaria luteobubalina TaxID=153913 RepID=A0AA39Q6F4_9AGAR|nr:hypothetical protein EDD18DRAFT_1353194 [Armillaria luteobubalina]
MPASVGHPHKYHSQDEKCQAHAESSARSYARHKKKINKCHQRNYQVVHLLSKPSQVSAALTNQNILQSNQNIKSLTKCLINRALVKNNEFLALVDRSPHTYAERLYQSFMETVTWVMPKGDDDKICQELMKLREVIQDVTKLEDRILNAAGVRDDLAEVQQIWEGMQEVEQWLEDILYGTIEGIDILKQAYKDQMLLYQQVLK